MLLSLKLSVSHDLFMYTAVYTELLKEKKVSVISGILCQYFCFLAAVSIVGLPIQTVVPTAALIITGLLAKTSCTLLLQRRMSPLRQCRERHPPYRSGSALT